MAVTRTAAAVRISGQHLQPCLKPGRRHGALLVLLLVLWLEVTTARLPTSGCTHALGRAWWIHLVRVGDPLCLLTPC